MTKTFLVTLLALQITSAIKAQTVNISFENKQQGQIIYAGNNEFYPVSISLNLELTNMVFSEGDATIFVIPAKNTKFKIGELTIKENGKRYNYSYTYKSAIGDVTISNYDKSFEYDLPFQKGKSFSVNQGYNGNFSHQNENALDFTMPEGTEILAARDGIVVQVVQNNTESCAKEECKKYNNYITIMHPDGTFAYYAHIKYNGSKYKTGDAVKRGDIIAYSGSVGWAAGPHLHFVCFLPGFEKRKSIETKFKIDKADKAVAIKEGSTYLRDY